MTVSRLPAISFFYSSEQPKEIVREGFFEALLQRMRVAPQEGKLLCYRVFHEILRKDEPIISKLAKRALQNRWDELSFQERVPALFAAIQNQETRLFQTLVVQNFLMDLYSEDLGSIFLWIAHVGNAEMVRVFLWKTRVPPQLRADALLRAADRGSEELVYSLMKDSQISMGTFCKGLIAAAESGSIKTVQLFINHVQSANIPSQATHKAFCEASKKGHVAILQLLVASKFFAHMNNRSFNAAVLTAVYHGHYSALVYLLSLRDYFLDVALDTYAAVLNICSEEGLFDIVEELISFPHYEQISIPNLGNAFVLAAQNGRCRVIDAFINSERFESMAVDDFIRAWGLSASLGFFDTIERLMQCDRVEQVPVDQFEIVFSVVLSNGYCDIAHLLIQMPQFHAISPVLLEYYLNCSSQ